MKIRRNIIFPVRTGPPPRISLYRYLLSVGAATRRPPDDTVIVPYARAAVWRCRPDFTGARQRGGADRQSDPPTARRILSVRQTAESSRPEPVAAAAGASRFLRIAGRRVLQRCYPVTGRRHRRDFCSSETVAQRPRVRRRLARPRLAVGAVFSTSKAAKTCGRHAV